MREKNYEKGGGLLIVWKNEGLVMNHIVSDLPDILMAHINIRKLDKEGKECKFFHPIVCKFSLGKRLCANKNSKFVHIKGTARKVKENLEK